MTNKRLHILLIFCIAAFTCCDKLFFDDLDNTSKIIIDDLTYSQVRTHDGFNITFKQDTAHKIEIEAPAEVLSKIQVFTNGDTLELKDENFKNWFPSYPLPKVTVYFPKIDRIYIDGPGNIKSAGIISQSRFRLTVSNHAGKIELNLNVEDLGINTGSTYNTGEYNIAGIATHAHFRIRSSCTLNALELKSENINITNHSFGDCYVNATGKLNVTINSSGNIFYKGDPGEINIDGHSGTGKLIPY